ncbi:MAG: two-component system cell cycle sensor histidine kinase/response regulator CckA [Myxococcota bacterium]|jgi:two-component system cell cycle sensor histidine kinase/response regulator CckA
MTSESQAPLRLLVIEDTPSDVHLLGYKLDLTGLRYELVHVTTASAAESEEGPFDVVLMDSQLPGLSGIAALRCVQRGHPRVPTIVLTGYADPANGVAMVRVGAQDYLGKDEATPRALERAIRYAIERSRSAERLRQTQFALDVAQTMEGVGRLASGVAHDANNLLSVVRGVAGLLIEEVDDPDLRQDLCTIESAAERASALIHQLLYLCRREEGHKEQLDLTEIIANCSLMLTRALGQHIEVDLALADGSCNVLADRAALERVLMNLVVNASQAMPTSGRLSVTCSAHNGVACLVVADTGHGMSEELQRRIFEPFFTTRGDGTGTGLGLAVVQQTIADHGGDIEVESSTTSGTRFTIRLPVVAVVEQPVARIVLARTADVSASDRTILLVEDQVDVRAVARRILERAGYTVLLAGSAAEGIEVADAHPGPIHLLLTDVVLPGGAAADAKRILRVRRPGIQVLYMSGCSPAGLRVHGLDPTSVDIMTKPFTSRSLTDRVAAALNPQPLAA